MREGLVFQGLLDARREKNDFIRRATKNLRRGQGEVQMEREYYEPIYKG